MVKYLCILGLFLCLNAKSQDLSVTLTTRNETCNLGSATVTVLLGAEPYSYLWSDGATTKTNNTLANGSYNVKVTADNGKDTTLYFTIEYEGCEISAEPYFTPNNDEYNDTWSISNLEKYPDFDLTVYNRWGQQVHHQSNTYKPWNGSALGIPLPDATYYYILLYSKSDKNKFIKGSISIVK